MNPTTLCILLNLQVAFLSSLSVNVDTETSIIVDDATQLNSDSNVISKKKFRNPYYYIDDTDIIDKEIDFVGSTLIDLESTFLPPAETLLQCCSNPVESFILREFSGPCGCQTLEQKWDRYQDWISINGGNIHPYIRFRHVSEMKPLISQIRQWQKEHRLLTSRRHEIEDEMYKMDELDDSAASHMVHYNDKEKKKHEHDGENLEPLPSIKVQQSHSNLSNKKNLGRLSSNSFHIHKHERGMYAARYYGKGEPVVKIPFNCAFSQFVISKYIENSTMYNNPIIAKLFPKPNFFMPKVMCFDLTCRVHCLV